jgi:hypothetical protein
MDYTDTELVLKYTNFLDWINKTFSGERKEKLLKLHGDDGLGARLLVAPASGKEHFHLAYPGGYMDHVMNVCKASVGVKKLYGALSGTIDFTDEEMFFSCLNHDLGKLGDFTGEYYLPEESEWHRKNQGSMFKFNGKLQYMDVTDRALFILQEAQIQITQKEWLGIKLSDGLYAEGSKSYLHSYNKDHQLKTNLPYVVHIADFMSCHAEYDRWKVEQ